ncbi:MAG: hypothetical protein Q8M94_14235 [Ignavibacteria bacterium]|nr:hypothetical protein [Ignavibacteria bacterium]
MLILSLRDANFKPKPISGLAGNYQVDYIGLVAANNKAYPFCMDDGTGNFSAVTNHLVTELFKLYLK